jgi:hypothetical protein
VCPRLTATRWATEVRRYRCLACGKALTVAPRGVLRGRTYSAPVVALALFLFGVEGQTHDTVRDAIGVHGTARAPGERQRWTSLVKWSRAARDGRLLEGVLLSTGTLREAAARAALAIEGHGPRGDDRVRRVWDGALKAAFRGTSRAAQAAHRLTLV